MPWCESCDRFYTPSTLSVEGDCPAGHHVADPPAPDVGEPLVQSDAPGRSASKAPAQVPGPGGAEDAKVRVPWHFWVLVGAVVIYLGWRLIQGIAWLVG